MAFGGQVSGLSLTRDPHARRGNGNHSRRTSRRKIRHERERPRPSPVPDRRLGLAFGWVVTIMYVAAYVAMGAAVIGALAFLVTHDGWWLWLTLPLAILVLMATGQGMFS